MVFFVSVPLWAVAIMLTIRAFTHPFRATVAIARFFLAVIGVIMLIVVRFSFNMLDTFTAPGMVFLVYLWFILCVSAFVGCFVARNRLGRIRYRN